MDIDQILLDLEVIKQVNENDKLAITLLPGSSRIFVDNTNYISAIKRWWNGYDRESCINYIEDLVSNIQKSSNTIIQGHHEELGLTLRTAIDNSIVGMENLKITYKNDSVVVARLVLCINTLNSLISTLKAFEGSGLSILED